MGFRAGGPSDLREEGEPDKPAHAPGMSYEDRKKVKQLKARLEKVIKLVEQKEVRPRLFVTCALIEW